MARLEAINNIVIEGLGYIDRGEVFDLPDDKITKRIMRNCVKTDGSPITVEVRTLEDLTLAELKVKAQAMHIPFSERTTKKQLIERLNEAEDVPRRVM